MNASRSLTAKFVFIGAITLSFLAVSIAQSYVFTHRMEGMARRINLAGRERMLMRSIGYRAMHILGLPPSSERSEHVRGAKERMAEYERALYGLRDGSKELDLDPIPEQDGTSLAHVAGLIGLWQQTQKPVLLSIMELPQAGRRQACRMCHEAVRENLPKIEILVRSLEEHHDRNIREFNRFRFYTFGIFLTATGLIILFVRRGIIAPVRKLMDATHEIEKGNFNVRIDVKTEDEIGLLAGRFNRMLQALDSAFDQLRRSEASLTKYNEELEERVRERTVKLEEASRIAETASSAKSAFLANMSHELRTPLNSILGFSEALAEGLAGPVTGKQREYLQDILESGEHLLKLINDILDLSKIEAGKLQFEPGRVDLRELIDRVIVLFREKALKHGITVSIDIDGPIREIVADEMKLKQVLVNLLSNAFKHAPDGGHVGVHARLCTNSGPNGAGQGADGGNSPVPYGRVSVFPADAVEIGVADTGPGIRKDDIPKLFQPFIQLESALTKKDQGTGLGLALCKKFVEMHNGAIWVESEAGKGAAFKFTIPVQQAPV
jgi:signal transduction histidine kinase